jgi:hypothetical protein
MRANETQAAPRAARRPLSRTGRRAAALLCRLAVHQAGPELGHNQGLRFARCERCDRDLVRQGGGSWRTPRGYRVVWRSPTEAEALGQHIRRPESPAAPAASAMAATTSDHPLAETVVPASAEPTAAPEAAEAPPAEQPVSQPAGDVEPVAARNPPLEVEAVPEHPPVAASAGPAPRQPETTEDSWDDLERRVAAARRAAAVRRPAGEPAPARTPPPPSRSAPPPPSDAAAAGDPAPSPPAAMPGERLRHVVENARAKDV